jgi:hypothetical protein
MGMDYEIIDLIMKQLKIKYSVKNESWDDVVSLLSDDDIDFAWQFVPTPERKKLFYLVGPIRNGCMYLWLKNIQLYRIGSHYLILTIKKLVW